MLQFENCNHTTQVRRLRGLAKEALKHFPIDRESLEFIHHGENATFKVTDRSGKKFLLRIHRNGYHTRPALLEELKWLKQIHRQNICVPTSLKNNRNSTLLEIKYAPVGIRQCDVFHWIDGRFISKSISAKDMYKIGALLANLRLTNKVLKVKHRRYWNSEGLVGENTKFGSIKELSGIKTSELAKLNLARKRLLKKLKRYEKTNPHQLGLIHADLHFGNLLKTKDGKIAAIDFDDCGYGFYLYDLAVPLIALEYHLRLHKRFKNYSIFKQELLKGYASIIQLSETDKSVLQDLILARKLLMLAWLNSRSDNPNVKKRLRKYVRNTIKYLERPYL